MSIKKLNPYLMFNGTAEKAIKLYETALGAKTERISRYGETPGQNVPAEHKNLVIHASLLIGQGVLMMSDATPDRPVATESNVQISLDFDDAADMAAKFEALAAGGKVRLPLQDMFWGARFGMLTDAYGVQWMFNCDKKS